MPCIVVEYASSISIHALREESDQCGNYQPGTSLISIHALREESDVTNGINAVIRALFLSTLSVRRATSAVPSVHGTCATSIHALREESDFAHFLFGGIHIISIHALREESDQYHHRRCLYRPISIHALREESDILRLSTPMAAIDFYPRSP